MFTTANKRGAEALESGKESTSNDLVFNYIFGDCQNTYKAPPEELLPVMNLIIEHVTGAYIEVQTLPDYIQSWQEFVCEELRFKNDQLFVGEMRFPLGIAVSLNCYISHLFHSN